jgi:ASC-1-like (ASCH) protein
MQHIAIMNKKWGMLNKILSGDKTVESRWYKTKRVPWDRIESGEVIYFKETGKPIEIKAEVLKISQFENLPRVKIRKLLRKYYRRLGIEERKLNYFCNLFKDKKYCILIFLKNAEKINKPFNISKSGFGSQVLVCNLPGFLLKTSEM